MPDVSADQRQRVKQQAARAALIDNNISASLVVAGGLVSFVSPPHGIALGIGSGLFWLCANYRQSIANDPARDDFDEVWITSASVDEDSLPGDEPRERTIYRFDAQNLVVSDGLYALLVSLERYDGARAADAADAVAAQVDAVAQNAIAIADQQDVLLTLVPEVNEAWVSLRDEHGLDWSTVSLGEIQQFYRDTVGALPPPSAVLANLAASVVDGAGDLLEPFDTGLAHPVLDAGELSPEPVDLIDQTFVDAINEVSSTLRDLVVEF